MTKQYYSERRSSILLIFVIISLLVSESYAQQRATFFSGKSTDAEICDEFCYYYLKGFKRRIPDSTAKKMTKQECYDRCLVDTFASKHGTPQDMLAKNTLQCRQNHAIMSIKEGPKLQSSDHMRHADFDGAFRCNPDDFTVRAEKSQRRYGHRMYYNANTAFRRSLVRPLNIILAVVYLTGLRGQLWSVYPSPELKNSAAMNCFNKTLYRTADGTCNSLQMPLMGSVGTPFVHALQSTNPHPIELPSPEAVAAIMKRPPGGDSNPKVLAPFSQLATAWIQFMTHDWFQHDVRAANRTVQQNQVTHWWDASQIYGSNQKQIDAIRVPGGKIFLDANEELDYDYRNRPRTGFQPNFWIGLHVFHTIFAREHNWIVDKLTSEYPQLTDDEKFEVARLCISATLAKIHTVEWTPTLLDNLALKMTMYNQWFGVVETAKKILPNWQSVLFSPIYKRIIAPSFGKFSTKDTLYNTSFFITEEFISVYRMHPLLPESLTVEDGTTYSLPDMTFVDARQLQPVKTTSTFLKALCVSPARALALQNYPAPLYDLQVPGRGTLNLAALDIQRDRERGLPRYNDARRQLLLEPYKKLGDLTDNPEELALLKSVYTDIEQVDFLVGSLVDKDRPDGFAFGIVPFHIFVVMASRRVFSDRFFQEDFNDLHYTKWGVNYVNDIDLRTILNRHFPEYKNIIPENPFMNWKV
jgi:Animal haem peroxidase